jgi:tRNA dimethylallyltransferase
VDPGAELQARIARRTAAMLDGGWPEEVERLRLAVPEDAPAWNASGYRQVRAMVEGHISRQAAQEAIVIETRQYAKRQRTWFRHQLPAHGVTRIDPSGSDWEDRVERWWREESRP